MKGQAICYLSTSEKQRRAQLSLVTGNKRRHVIISVLPKEGIIDYFVKKSVLLRGPSFVPGANCEMSNMLLLVVISLLLERKCSCTKCNS